jgi:hypothetical protein
VAVTFTLFIERVSWFVQCVIIGYLWLLICIVIGNRGSMSVDPFYVGVICDLKFSNDRPAAHFFI